MNILIPAVTSGIALLFAVLLLDQWRVRRRSFQLVWAAGMLFFGVASGCEAVGATSVGWNEAMYRTWYLAGAMWTAGWLGLGTALLLGKTRFGYAFAAGLVLAGLFTLLTQQRNQYPGTGWAPVVYLVAALVLALAIAVETYFASERWPRLAALAVGGVTVVSLGLMMTTALEPPGYLLLPSGLPDPALFPGTLRLLTPFMNITGGLSLALGALFSAYVFMPKRRVLAYSLDPAQKGDELLFNLVIGCVAIPVNFVASLPGAVRAFFAGRLHNRVPATILIAIGGFLAAGPDLLSRFGMLDYTGTGKLLAVIFLLAGFLVSSDAFAEFRVPFTGIVLRHRRKPGQEPESEATAERLGTGPA